MVQLPPGAPNSASSSTNKSISGKVPNIKPVGSSASSSKLPDLNSMNDFQKQLYLMHKENAFNRHMSNTAIQRRVRDMRKAGINPLAIGNMGSASSPMSASGSTNPNSKYNSASNARADASTAFGALGSVGGMLTTIGILISMFA